jgi:hypothetical protein
MNRCGVFPARLSPFHDLRKYNPRLSVNVVAPNIVPIQIGRRMVEGLQVAAPAVLAATCDEQQGECGGGWEPLSEDMRAKLENLDCSQVCIEFISDGKLALRGMSTDHANKSS